MASISTDKRGCRRILYQGMDGRRKSLHLGKVPLRAAASLKLLVEQLLASQRTGHPIEAGVRERLEALHPTIRSRLASLGLAYAKPIAPALSLGEYVAAYVQQRTGVKPATKEIWRQGENSLVDYFGREKSLGEITPGDADEYLQHLGSKGLEPMTIRKRLLFAKMVFRAAGRKRLIAENPFGDVSYTASMPDKSFFVTPEMVARLLPACPDHHWRMILLLARYGGLRCPSEVLSLRWQDVHWDENKMTVRSPKTEHHPGKESRVVPIFPELRQQLEECFDRASDGAVYVIDERYRRTANGAAGWRNCNLRTRFERIIHEAGLTKWHRLFHNLRSSRQTELAERFPSHVVCAWLGNSEDIAKKHYYQVTDAHFATAAAAGPKRPVVPTSVVSDTTTNTAAERATGDDAESDALTTQNPTH